MEKIFKKSLALMVSAALCLTAFVGCLTVNAEETATPTYTITAQNGKAGDTVTVNVDGTNLTSVCGQQVFINIPAALTIASVKDNAGNPYINVANVTEGEAFDYNVVTTETTKQVRFADIINFDSLTTAEFHIVFELTIPDTAAVGATYEIAFDTATMFADIDENEIGITVTPKTITVQESQPACEHVWEFLSAIPATADAEGSITLKCSACEETKTETVSYNAYNTVAQFSAACESQIVLQYDVWTSLFKENSDITTTIFVFEKDDYSDGALTTATTVLTPADAVEFTAQGKTAYRFSLGVAAKMLNDTCKATVYCQADGVWYNGMVNTKTFVDFANNQLGSASTADSLKTLFVDLLNYGSSAQAAFNYNADNLANAGIDAYQNYATQTDPEATNVKNATYTLEAGKFIPASYSVMAESNVQIRYSFMPYQYTPVADNVRIHFEYTDYLGTAKSIDYYSYDKLVADGNTDKIAAGEYFTVTGGRYYVDFDKLAAADCDVKITATIFDGDRPTEPDAIVDYSIGSFVAIERDNGSTNLTFINNMYKYCKSALTYFTTK